MEDTAAKAARGSSSPSQAPPSPEQCRGSTDTEVQQRCPICLDNWREPSFVMPCLHSFCYACIWRWAKKRTRCPLCKGIMTSILYSVRADNAFEEIVLIPPVTPSEVRPAESAPIDPDPPNPHLPEEHQEQATEGDDQRFIGGFHLPNWMSCFSLNSALQQTLHSWFSQSLEMFREMFETVTSRVQHTPVPEQQHYREDRHCPRQQDTRGTTGQEDSSSPLTPAPARSSVDEMPSTSSSATGWGPRTYPSAFTPVHVEQKPQKKQKRLYPGPPNFVRGSDPSPSGPQRSQKRRARSPKGLPAQRPRY